MVIRTQRSSCTLTVNQSSFQSFSDKLCTTSPLPHVSRKGDKGGNDGMLYIKELRAKCCDIGEKSV